MTHNDLRLLDAGPGEALTGIVEPELEYLPPIYTPPPPSPAGHALAAIGRYFAPKITAREMSDLIILAMESGDTGAKSLNKQAQVLDGLFHRLTAQAFEERPSNAIDPQMLEFALRSQKQCNATFYVSKILEKISKNDEQTE